LLKTYEWVSDEVLEELPVLRDIHEELGDALPFTHEAISLADQTDATQRARGRILAQASNDYLDLLYEATCGRGRPALRTARTLFEHLVNYRSIDTDSAMAERYCDHESLGAVLDLELNTAQEDEFEGKLRKRFRHWRNRLERTHYSAAKAAIGKYGPSYRSSWAVRTVLERARVHGLEGDYDFYRLCSAISHGTASGTIGIRAEVAGTDVVRTGPALSLVPLALRYGNRYFSMILTDTISYLGADASHRLRRVTQSIEDSLADFDGSTRRRVVDGLGFERFVESAI
jgi:hypothetical protein